MPALGGRGFVIVASDVAGAATRSGRRRTPATCADCLREMRRSGRPSVRLSRSSTARTAARATRSSATVPYDRARTTMAGVRDVRGVPGGVRRPAPTGASTPSRSAARPAARPRGWSTRRHAERDGDPIAAAVARLAAARSWRSRDSAATTSPSTRATRRRSPRCARRKHREDRPFALMVATVAAAARALRRSTRRSASADQSRRGPIVLLAAPARRDVAPAVAPGAPVTLGVMLPYTPLHHLLLEALGGPIVLTSGNVSDEPIAFDDTDAARAARPRSPTASSPTTGRSRPGSTTRSCRSCGDRPMPLRRSRGYVPDADRRCRGSSARPVLACGSELKNTFCLGRGPHAFVSHHIGDLENFETFAVLSSTASTTCSRLLDVDPEVVAHDLHPDYLSTQYAPGARRRRAVGVQHHHAHIASCLADNGVDRTGHRCRVRRARLRRPTAPCGAASSSSPTSPASTRVAHLAPVPLPGGRRAIREPWRMAASYLDAAFDGAPPDRSGVAHRHGRRWDQVRSVPRAGHQLAADVQRRPAVRRGRRAARRARRRQLRGPGRDRARTARRSRRSRAGIPSPVTDDDVPRIEVAAPGPGGRGRPARRRRPCRCSRPGSTTRSPRWSSTCAAASRHASAVDRRAVRRRVPELAAARRGASTASRAPASTS